MVRLTDGKFSFLKTFIWTRSVLMEKNNKKLQTTGLAGSGVLTACFIEHFYEPIDSVSCCVFSAHTSLCFTELVCSNSLKSTKGDSAAGILKI